ncbi:putative uncharacterized protein DDB_G0282133 [Megalobrama amblycephala]|uniref:putative uncharacterized protein DDB_G0282133 n=1 Tax=Megalobrama amblycephala TaxID=75352 RepID=UPI002013EDED|nr:putative uncharacterized protein DDB_G0282133 [Megalobrama amblycephala]
MDLQISVFLLFILFTAGHSLICYNCTSLNGTSLNGTCTNQTVQTCSNGSQCESSTEVSQYGNITKFRRCADDCKNGSKNTGVLKMTSYCCNTDRCNEHDSPDPSNVTNGKTCFSCDGQNCTTKLNCSGSDDYCFTQTEASGNQSVVLKGCVSKYFCDFSTSVSNDTVIGCCEGNLCNGAANTSVTLNSTYNGNNSVTLNSTYNGNNSVTLNSTYNGNNSVTLNTMYNGNNSVTLNSTYNGNNSVTLNSTYNGNNTVTQNITHNVNNTITLNSTYNGNNSVTLNTMYNGAQSVTQSFLFLCCSLFSYFLLH